MKSVVRLMILALGLPVIASAEAKQDNQTGADFNPNILIFTSEVRNFMDQASELTDLNDKVKAAETEADAQSLKKSIEDKTALLQLTGHRVAEAYFAEVTLETKNEFNEFLTQTLTSRSDLQNYYVFLGNAFAENASRAVTAHKQKLKKIYVWSTIGGVILGFAGGYYFLKWRGVQATGGELLKSGLVGFGIAAVVSTGGYAVRYVLPVDQSISNALDFIARYPHGDDFIDDLQDKSLDLALQVEELDSENPEESQ